MGRRRRTRACRRSAERARFARSGQLPGVEERACSPGRRWDSGPPQSVSSTAFSPPGSERSCAVFMSSTTWGAPRRPWDPRCVDKAKRSLLQKMTEVWIDVCRTTGVNLRGPSRSEGHVSFNFRVGRLTSARLKPLLPKGSGRLLRREAQQGVHWAWPILSGAPRERSNGRSSCRESA